MTTHYVCSWKRNSSTFQYCMITGIYLSMTLCRIWNRQSHCYYHSSPSHHPWNLLVINAMLVVFVCAIIPICRTSPFLEMVNWPYPQTQHETKKNPNEKQIIKHIMSPVVLSITWSNWSPKTNITSENGWLENPTFLWGFGLFSGAMFVSFRKGMSNWSTRHVLGFLVGGFNPLEKY